MKRLKLTVLQVFIYVLLCPVIMNGDDNLHIPRSGVNGISLPSVDVADLCHKIDCDFDYSTGKAVIVEPLYTVECTEIKLPVTLSYQTGGLKVDDEAGPVGLAWTLNYGGFISRNIAGRPDNSDTKENINTAKHQSRFENCQGDMSMLANIAFNAVDSYYDRYYWQAGAESGTFIMPDGYPTLLTKTDTKIEKTNNGFKITTVDGSVYCFAEGESVECVTKSAKVSYSDTIPRYNEVCTWRLDSIISPNYCDTITFDYSRIPDKKKNFGDAVCYVGATANMSDSQHCGHLHRRPSERSNSGMATTYTYTNRKALKLIKWRGGALRFYSDSAQTSKGVIDSIKVITNEGSEVRRIKFDYASTSTKYGSNAAVLQNYVIYADNILIDGAEFDYNPTYSISKDIFGYNNAVSGRYYAPTNHYDHLSGVWVIELADGSIHEQDDDWVDVPGYPFFTAPKQSVFAIYKDSLGLNPARLPYYDPQYPSKSGPAQGSLTKITRKSGIEISFEYEPAFFESVDLDSCAFIGIRLTKETIEDRNTGNNRVRELRYYNPETDFPLDRLPLTAFLSQSGSLSNNGKMGSPTMGSTTSTLLSSSCVPGLAPENATVYYGKVNERIYGSGIDGVIITTYFFDLSRVPAKMEGTVSTHTVSSNDEKMKGTLIGMLSDTNLSDSLRSTLLTLLSPIFLQSYYRENFSVKAPLKRKESRMLDYAEDPSYQVTEYKYSYAEQDTVVMGFYSDNLTRNSISFYNGLERSLCRTPLDFSKMLILADVGKMYVDSVIVKDYDIDGTCRTVITEYEYNDHLKPFQYTDLNLDTGQPQVHTIDWIADNSLLFKVTTSCGGDKFIKTNTYTNSLWPHHVSGVSEDEYDRRWSLLCKETFEHGTCTVTKDYTYSTDTVSGSSFLSSCVVKNGNAVVDSVSIPQYNCYGRPLTIIRNGDTPVNYQWSGDGLYLVSTDIGGGMRTVYGHRPLVGYTSVTTPAGTTTEYGYTGGRLSSVRIAGDLINEYRYHLYEDGSPYYNKIETVTHLSDNGGGTFTSTAQLDGFGNKIMQWVNSGEGTYGCLTRYDALCRPIEQYAEAPLDPDLFICENAEAVAEYYSDSIPCSRISYDKYSRAVSATIAGSGYAQHPAVNEYMFNSSNPSHPTFKTKFRRTTNGLNWYAQYPKGSVAVTKQSDGDGRQTYSFTDFRGRLLSTKAVDGNNKAETHYIYDDADNLVMVIPPKASASLPSSMMISNISNNQALQDYAYIYNYDSAFRLVEKKMPGTPAVKYWYDRTNRLIFSQDGNQRDRGVVSFQIPDRYGRTVLTGECSYSASLVNGVSNSVVQAIHANSGYNGPMLGYSVNLPLSNADILSASYYDDYSYLGISEFAQLSAKTGQYAPLVIRENNMGLLTGRLEKVLKPSAGGDGAVNGVSDYISTAYYYDPRERLARSAAIDHRGGFDFCDMAYSNTDMLISQAQTHMPLSGTARSVEYNYNNDGFDRPQSVSVKRGQTEETLICNTYNDAGRLSSVALGASTNVGYTYTVHGALRSISAPHFTQTLYYTDAPVPSYSGNIGAYSWKGNDNVERKYSFTYDFLNRLTSAAYSEISRPNISYLNLTGTNNTPDYSTSYAYDLNSNLLSVTRAGVTGITLMNSVSLQRRLHLDFGTVDNMNLTYSGNRLVRADDTADDVLYKGAADFYDGASQQTEYTYDSNGNLLTDSNRGISAIEYNVLNLPSRITFDDGSAVSHCYDASGTLLRRHIYYPGDQPAPGQAPVPVIDTEDRHGAFVYRSGALSRIDTPTGYIEGDSIYHYLKDYQGNVRQVVSHHGVVVQDNHYYPYGMIMGESSGIINGYRNLQNNNSSARPNSRLFGCKDWISTSGLNLYDVIARYHDPATARFTTPDPQLEKYRSFGQYLFCGGNPIMITDLNGREWANKEDADRLLKDINKRIKRLDECINNLNSKIDKKRKKGKDVTKDLNNLDNIKKQKEFLPLCISDVIALGNDPNNIYEIKNTNGGAHYVRLGDSGHIEIESSCTAITLHEIRHVMQSLSKGCLKFDSNNLLRNAGTYDENMSTAKKV